MHGRVFGLDVDAGFDVTGLHPARGGPPRPVSVELTTADQLADQRARSTLEPIATRPWARVGFDPANGYFFDGAGYGSHWVSTGGDHILCAPPSELDGPAWQRYLIGQLLPFAAALRGLEPLHASGVVIAGRALGIVGASRAGKTTLAVSLALEGADFLTDDVLALEPYGDGLLAHPGAGLANVRRTEPELGARAEAELGPQVATDEDAIRVELNPHPEAVPLGGICFLDRDPPGEALHISATSPVDPRMLLGATFNFVLRNAERLALQLDVCARAARTNVMHAAVPEDVPPIEVARALRDYARAAWA